MSNVSVAQPEDIPAWLVLAAEVEPLFGPMVNEPSFHQALKKNISRGTALCVRQSDGPAGFPLLGGLLYSPKPHLCTIGWLAVAERHRRNGIGRRLFEHMLGVVEAPEFVVMTFGTDHPGGKAARGFYERMGFHPAEIAPNGSEGGSRQVFRRAGNKKQTPPFSQLPVDPAAVQPSAMVQGLGPWSILSAV